VLGHRHAFPVNWPLGDGFDFRGIYDRQTREAHLFERTPGGAYRAPVETSGIEHPALREAMAPDVFAQCIEEIGLLEGAGAPLDLDAVRAGRVTPVFFGSAMNNFGVQLLLDRFLELAPGPASRRSGGVEVLPDAAGFSAFVFKIQANMDPKHRDHVAFVRVVSGTFRRDMNVVHARTGKRLRLSNSKRLFAQERETVDEAYAGDVVGIVGNHDFRIGDTLAEGEGVEFDEIPVFAPETFAFLHNDRPSNFKRFREGVSQLLKEGVAQSYELPDAVTRVTLLGAVGGLQFEVLQYRLETEYGATSRLESAPWSVIRWVQPGESAGLPRGADAPRPGVQLPTGAALARDGRGGWVVLFPNAWSVGYFEDPRRSARRPGRRAGPDPRGHRLLHHRRRRSQGRALRLLLHRRVIAFTGGRPGMISAATGAMALVMVLLVKEHGLQYLLAATVLTGVLQIARRRCCGSAR
jgi:peptide chain release factor 3